MNQRMVNEWIWNMQNDNRNIDTAILKDAEVNTKSQPTINTLDNSRFYSE